MLQANRKRKWTRQVTAVLQVAPGEDQVAPALCHVCSAQAKRFCSDSREDHFCSKDETEIEASTAMNVWESGQPPSPSVSQSPTVLPSLDVSCPLSSALSACTPRELTLEEKKEELMDLWKCQAVLLKFAKECRLHMHSYKSNFIRLSVWSDCVAVAKEAERQRQVRQSTTKETIMSETAAPQRPRYRDQWLQYVSDMFKNLSLSSQLSFTI